MVPKANASLDQRIFKAEGAAKHKSNKIILPKIIQIRDLRI
jgi:hypothetical protein